jgi:sugar lactone lactonase YvrE
MKRSLIITLTAIVAMCALMIVDALAHPPWGIVVDRRHQVYFSDLENIWKIDAQGRLAMFRPGVGGKHTHDLRMDEDDNLYGEELSYEPATQRYTSALWKMTPAGELTYVLAPTTDPPKGMSIWRDRDGNMYSALWKSNSERELFILKRGLDGKVSTLFGSPEAASNLRQVVLYSIGGMAFGPDGSLYLTDGASVRKLTMDGTLTTLTRNLSVEKPADNPMGSGPEMRLMGLAVDAQGNVLAADYSNRRVLKIVPGKEAQTLMRTEPPWSPAGVTISGSDVYVLEIGFTPPRTYLGPRVRKLSSDGKVTVLAIVGEGQKVPEGKTATRASDSNGENVEGTSAGNTGRGRVMGRRSLYVLFAVGAGLFALVLILWRARKVQSPQS